MTEAAWVGLVLVLALGWAATVLAWRAQRRRDADAVRTARERIGLLTEAIDRADAAIVIYDRDDRLVHASQVFRDLYAPAADRIVPGRTFREMLDDVVAAGLVPGDGEVVQRWARSRLHMHDEGGTYVRRFGDGHWRRITDQRLADGSRLGFSVDVTDLIEQGQALQAAQAAAQQARQRLADAIEALPAGFQLFDADDRLVMSNQVLRDIFPRIADLLAEPGHTFDELVRANVAAGALHDVTSSNVDEWLARRHAQRRQPINHLLYRTGSRWLRTVERRTEEGWLVGIVLDVTEAIEQREAAEAARARLQDAIDALPDGFALYDREDRLVICNSHYRRQYRASAPAIIVGNTFEAILRYGLARGQYPQAAGRDADWLRERLHRHRHPGEPLTQELPGNRWVRIDERPTRDGGVAGVSTDVTELVLREQALQRSNAELDAARQRLERLSDTDGLTEIANRRQFDRRLREEWQRARRHARPLALLMIDVDHFKRYNGAHGHPQGDDCLRRVAAALSTAVQRASDLVARYGGEEFVVLLPDTDADGQARIGAACLAAVDAAAIPHGDSPVAAHVTVSIGAAGVADPSQGGTPEALLRAADAAMFEAKRQGRHRVGQAPPI